MSTTARPVPPATSKRFGTKLGQFSLGALYALLMLLPKLLHLRRNPQSWLIFRLALGIAGAALVVLPLKLWDAPLLSVVGLGMFLASVLLPPARSETSLDDKARELGALVVVNGGEYQPENGIPTAVQLFVGAQDISVLDGRLKPILLIPAAGIRNLDVAQTENRWHLRVEWSGRVAQFAYRGFFAEHLARVAESTLRSALRTTLPVLQPASSKPSSRAAGA